MPRLFLRLPVLFFCLLMAAPGWAQRPLRVVLDCQNTGCDQSYIRTELPFADFVRDAADADVQVLLTSQGNGAGGRTYTLRFLGQGTLAGKTDVLEVATRAGDTDDTRRRALVRGFAAGLVSYAARVGPLDRFRILYDRPAGEAVLAPPRDPWNRWVFSASVRGNLDGQQRYRSHNLNYNASARRVTEAWKTNLSAYASESQDVYVLTDSSEDVVSQTSLGANGLVVKSLGPQLSAGTEASVYRSSYDNTAGSVRIAPALEYDFYPYSESTRRSVTLRYGVGVRRIAYQDTTIYDEIAETLVDHRLGFDAEFQQPWGTFELSAAANQYLNHLDQYSVSTDVQADVRLFRGLGLNLSAGARLLRNQRNISGAGESDEDVYTRRRALATGYRYFMGAGLSYTFGSALSGAVNPRF